MIGTEATALSAPLDYRYALDAAMASLGGVSTPVVLCNVPQLEHEVRQRVPHRRDARGAQAALWVEPLVGTWRAELEALAGVLLSGGRLAVIATRPPALVLPERRAWSGRPLGLRLGSLGRLRRALSLTGFAPGATYGLHSPLVVALSVLSHLSASSGHPEFGDRLHFAARLRYCTSGPLAALSTVALLTATKGYD